MKSSVNEAMDRMTAALRSPHVRYWVKTALTDSLDRDYAEAARDADLLARLLRDMAEAAAPSSRAQEGARGPESQPGLAEC